MSQSAFKMRILSASGNKHKIGEIRNILEIAGIKIIFPPEIGGIPDVDENGSSFGENAGIKAFAAAKFAKITAFADDSGLEVRALGGTPGIFSARYADTNEKRIQRVLRELEEKNRETAAGKLEHRNAGIRGWKEEESGAKNRWLTSGGGEKERFARFVCVIALAAPEGVMATFRGEVYGRIAYEPRGNAGFGYDPIFIPDGYDRTFAELGPEVKDKISHRAKALLKLKEFIQRKLK